MLIVPEGLHLRLLATACFAVSALLMSDTLPALSQPVATQQLIKKVSGYTLTLDLPATGMIAGKSIDLRLHKSSQTPADALSTSSISASLSMPSMAGMSMRQPAVTVISPGNYAIAVTCPHAGEYQLGISIRPASGPSLRTSFLLSATLEIGSDTLKSPGRGMMMTLLAGVSEMQQASGTSWQPALSPMYGVDKTYGRWSLMTHYNVSINYDRQEGPRGDYQYNSTNWLMAMADRNFGSDLVQIRTMLTLEPLTVTPRGYPLLFQSGEQYDGSPIVDRQHPHNLFMEIAGRYTHPVSSNSAVFAYVAPSGEPALGPTAFMHRQSALDLPMAPITHHWMDSTHIDFGVLTVGGWRRNVQLETSYFTGREPDQYRYEIGPIHMDSYSGRLSYNPGPNWSTQVSYGYLHSPEALRPGEDIRRTTASASYLLRLRRSSWWASTVGIGNNSADSINSTAYLIETELNLEQRNSFFARFEYVNKLGEELAITPGIAGHDLGELTLGYVRDITPNRPYQIGVGSAITINGHASNLNTLYGQTPLGLWFFVRIRPAPMRM